MANPNTILAEQILAKLKEANLLDPNVDDNIFKLKLETGKLTNTDWANTLISPNKENPTASNETTETGN